MLGEPLPDLRTLADPAGRAELAGSLSGGLVLDASDVFFSPPHNLIAPGDSHGMHDGWETRRRRGEGHDWVVLRLAAEAEIERVELDTSNFKGNYPDACSLDVRTGLEGAGETECVRCATSGREGPGLPARASSVQARNSFMSSWRSIRRASSRSLTRI